MAKKNRRNLQQKINKQHYLQTALAHQASRVTTVTKTTTNPASVTAPDSPERTSLGLKRTGLSVVVIVALLAGGYYLEHRTPHFLNFGNWLYSFLRLNS